MRTLVFDLETQKTFDQVGGQRNAALLGISIVGVYDYSDGEYKLFREKELGAFLELLKKTDLLVGFNSRSFDQAVLQPYYPSFDLSKIPHFDILEEIHKSIGIRLRLESVARSTLLEGKSGDGLDAIHYFNAGDWKSLAKYCLDDVRITKDIYEYAKNHGHIWYVKSGQLEPIPFHIGEKTKVKDTLEDALKNHEQVKIEYIEARGDGAVRKKTSIDIREIRRDKVKAFCHTLKGDIVVDLPKIFSAEKAGAMLIYQPSLI